MANNPYVNKVIYGNDTVMDISDTTATEGDVANGAVFYKANGARSVGSATPSDPEWGDITGTLSDQTDLQTALDSKFDRSEQRVLGAKNLLPFPYKEGTKTLEGVTFTVNTDGSVTANGTATNTSYIYLFQNEVHKMDKECILNGCPANGSDNTYKIIFRDETTGVYYEDKGDGIVIPSYVNTHTITSYIRIGSGTTINNLTFYPMIRLASDPDDTYVPYAMTNKELTDGLGAVRITLSKAEYDALSSAEKNDPDKVYYVYDDTSDGNFYYLERSGITVTNTATAVRIPASGSDSNIHTTSNIVSIVSDSGAGWRTISVSEGYVEVTVSKTFSDKAIGIYVDNP